MAEWSPQPRRKQTLDAWARWRAARSRFKGLDVRLEARHELRNITKTKDGYQVRLRPTGKPVFRRSVRGHSEESLREAMRIRDRAMREIPGRRVHQIPAQVLKALGLSAPIIGITRLPSRSVYRVVYRDDTGRRRVRQFYFRGVPEEDAYAAAIAFLQSLLK
ncbi:MAG: hypothetical protein ABI217_08855 [Chthoniobacterales bacterium]